MTNHPNKHCLKEIEEIKESLKNSLRTTKALIDDDLTTCMILAFYAGWERGLKENNANIKDRIEPLLNDLDEDNIKGTG